MVRFDFVNLDAIVKALKPVPWRAVVYLATSSFVAASLTSSVIAFLLLPKASTGTGHNLRVAAINPAITTVTLPNNSANIRDSDIDLILRRNIFNSEGALGDGSGLDQDGDSIPKSDLPIKLLGVIYGGNPFTGMATIENTAKNNLVAVNSFLVGDLIMKEAKLIEIHRKRIILEREGRKEYIELSESEIRRSTRTPAKSKGPATTSLVGADNAPVSSKPPPEAFKEPGFEREGFQIKMATSYKDRLLSEDFTKVLQDAKASPNMVEKEIKGFRLTKIREGSVYEKAGLQNEDVVEEINGVPLNDTSGAVRLLQQLRNEKEIELRVRRGGSAFNMMLKVL